MNKKIKINKQEFPRSILLIATSIALFISLIVNFFFLSEKKNNNNIHSVVDGDTVLLVNGRRARLIGIDAPELGLCFGNEAKKRLSDILNRKNTKMDILAYDDFGRPLILLFINDEKTPVNVTLIKEGSAKLINTSNPYMNDFKEADKEARISRVGIYSEKCFNPPPPSDNCRIKGNIRNGDKTYHLPNCPNYSQTDLSLSFGDKWFCNVMEAKNEGFEIAKGCKK